MKTTLTVALLLGTAASLPAWAGEGAGDPFPVNTPPVSTSMTMKPGGNTDPFRWSAGATASQMTVVSGGNTDPYKWSASPMPPPPAARNLAGARVTRNPS